MEFLFAALQADRNAVGAAPQKPVKGRRETIDYADKDFQLYCKEAGGGGDLPGFYGDRRGSHAPG